MPCSCIMVPGRSYLGHGPPHLHSRPVLILAQPALLSLVRVICLRLIPAWALGPRQDFSTLQLAPCTGNQSGPAWYQADGCLRLAP